MTDSNTTLRQPVLFLGHGSPMNVVEDNDFRTAWQGLGEEFGPEGRWPRPKAILCISAHWVTRGWWLTAMAQPRTIHDFGGFPQVLFEQHYPAPGAPEPRPGRRACAKPTTSRLWGWTTIGAWIMAVGACSSPCSRKRIFL